MKNSFISLNIALLICFLATGCTFYTSKADYSRVPEQNLEEMKYLVYIDDAVDLDNQKVSAESLRTKFAKKWPKIFTDDDQKGVAVNLRFKFSSKPQSNTANFFSAITLSIIPFAETNVYSCDLYMDADDEVKSVATVSREYTQKTGFLAPILYLFASEPKGIVSQKQLHAQQQREYNKQYQRQQEQPPEALNTDAEEFEKAVVACAVNLGEEKLAKLYAKRPKRIIFKEDTDK